MIPELLIGPMLVTPKGVFGVTSYTFPCVFLSLIQDRLLGLTLERYGQPSAMAKWFRESTPGWILTAHGAEEQDVVGWAYVVPLTDVGYSVPTPHRGLQADKMVGVFVDEGYRDLGIGRALLEPVAQESRELASFGCHIYCFPYSPGSQSFYEHFPSIIPLGPGARKDSNE